MQFKNYFDKFYVKIESFILIKKKFISLAIMFQ